MKQMTVSILQRIMMIYIINIARIAILCGIVYLSLRWIIGKCLSQIPFTHWRKDRDQFSLSSTLLLFVRQLRRRGILDDAESRVGTTDV
jgi:hypothetical protein